MKQNPVILKINYSPPLHGIRALIRFTAVSITRDGLKIN